MKLSDHLHAAADGFDAQAAEARRQQDPESAARSDRLAEHMRRLAGNHQCAVIWDGDASHDPQQLGKSAATTVADHVVREVRHSLGVSQAAFAARLNALVRGARVTQQAVNRWESGRVAPSPSMAAIIRSLYADPHGAGDRED